MDLATSIMVIVAALLFVAYGEDWMKIFSAFVFAGGVAMMVAVLLPHLQPHLGLGTILAVTVLFYVGVLRVTFMVIEWMPQWTAQWNAKRVVRG